MFWSGLFFGKQRSEGKHSGTPDADSRRRIGKPPVITAVRNSNAAHAVAVHSANLDVRIEVLPTGWNAALQRGFSFEVRPWKDSASRPRVVTLGVPRAAVTVRSFFFRELPESQSEPAQAAPSHSPTASPAWNALLQRIAEGRRHRIAPPQDLIKLEDRLQCLLQPSLETLLIERNLEFPFAPFPYQLEGVAFLYPRHSAILADEMGLGKTMQAITAVRLLIRGGDARSVLLVCPKPLVTNWKREFEQWAPEIPVLVIEGDQNRRRWQWEQAPVPVKIANYELLPRDREILESTDQNGRPRVAFDLVVLDESQRIKNRAGATSQAVRAIARRRSWALTGTPVENSTEDLVGIFEFLSPGFLSPDMKPSHMGRTIADFVLRRTKDQVLTDLPPKLIRDAEMELSPEQRETYRLAESEGILRLTEMGDAAAIQHVFELVLRLKQICNFDPATGASVKMERLEADLEEIADSGRKAIVFSQWVSTLEEIARRLDRFHPLLFHGKIPSARRDDVIRRFRDDPRHAVLLMSYGAGSVGLNLQFAGYVFLFDRWWNPAVEDQAINRAHRIGAGGPVTVTRFLAVDTIEQRINAVLEEKRRLFETVFSGVAGPRKLALTQEEIFGLFNLRCPAPPVSAPASSNRAA
ncbi:DEAD/DEAH box helicase [Thermopirellula anaerolimosa]